MKKIIVMILLIASASLAKAQFIEDALRYAGGNNFITPRAAGLNVAYYGVADDIAALIANPAGLTLIPKSELSVGFGFSHKNNDVSILSSNSNFAINNEFLSHIALSMPVKTGKGLASVAIGYFKDNDFKNSYEYSIFNPQSSYINQQSQAKKRWTYDLLLADEFGNTNIKDSLRQNSWVDEKGGIHNFTGGAAFDISEYASVGFSLTGKWGTFEYVREFSEIDELNKYNTWQVDDFNRLDMREKVSQEVSGITGQIGVQGRVEDFMRIGFAIKFPTWYEVNETFSVRHSVEFDPSPSGVVDRFDTTSSGKNSYNVTTPFVYSAGLSFHLQGLTFSAGVEYTDVTQIEFSDATAEVQEKLDYLNRIALRNLVGQTTWGFGAEYKIPTLPLVARASYANTTSPYHLDIPNANKSYVAIGGSLYLGQSIRIDGLMRWTDVSEQRTAYGTEEVLNTFSKYVLKQTPLSISLGLTYRY